MRPIPVILAITFMPAHFAIFAPFVPVGSILPAGLGALSMTSMALALVLAARWPLVDRLLGGPDKSYALHRWLGGFALAGALGHWALASSFGEGVFPVLSESGEDVGTLAAMGLLVMSAAAMVRAIPYHLWKASHMLMGPVFLLAAYHTFFVASPLAVGAAPWSFMAGVSIIGLVAWAQTLRRKSAPTRLVTVRSIKLFEGGVDVTLTSDKPLPSFSAGQFATLAHNTARAEAHPFSLAGGDETSRRFVIRASGDWTRHLATTLVPGDQMRISKPMGRFRPQTKAQRAPQLWIAGGVGVAPFLAALEGMDPDTGADIHLVYCMSSAAQAPALENLQRHAARLPQLRLTLASSAEGTRLRFADVVRFLRGTPENTEIYVCGAPGLKALVHRACTSLGRARRLHSEDADFRGAWRISDVVQAGHSLLYRGVTLWRSHAASGS